MRRRNSWLAAISRWEDRHSRRDPDRCQFLSDRQPQNRVYRHPTGRHDICIVGFSVGMGRRWCNRRFGHRVASSARGSPETVSDSSRAPNVTPVVDGTKRAICASGKSPTVSIRVRRIFMPIRTAFKTALGDSQVFESMACVGDLNSLTGDLATATDSSAIVVNVSNTPYLRENCSRRYTK